MHITSQQRKPCGTFPACFCRCVMPIAVPTQSLSDNHCLRRNGYFLFSNRSAFPDFISTFSAICILSVQSSHLANTSLHSNLSSLTTLLTLSPFMPCPLSSSSQFNLVIRKLLSNQHSITTDRLALPQFTPLLFYNSISPHPVSARMHRSKSRLDIAHGGRRELNIGRSSSSNTNAVKKTALSCLRINLTCMHKSKQT